MARWLLRRFRTAILVLALGVGLSPGLSPGGASASASAGQMALAAGAGTPMPDPCDGCAEDGGTSQDACVAACAGAGPAILPVAAVPVTPRPAAFPAAASFGGDGRLGPPDPDPPRPSALG